MTEYDPYIALDPRIGLGEQQPVNSFVEDPRLDINEVIDDKIDLDTSPAILDASLKPFI